MMDWVQGMPLWEAIAFLYFVVLCRAGGTYAVGRGARSAVRRGRFAEYMASPQFERATAIVHRWGAPVVALSFLTVGFQTAVNAAAGVLGMPLRRYLPALLVGGLVWSIIYATVGLAAIGLWFRLFLHSPWAAVVVLALVLATIVAVVALRRRRGSLVGTATEKAAAAATQEMHEGSR